MEREARREKENIILSESFVFPDVALRIPLLLFFEPSGKPLILRLSIFACFNPDERTHDWSQRRCTTSAMTSFSLRRDCSRRRMSLVSIKVFLCKKKKKKAGIWQKVGRKLFRCLEVVFAFFGKSVNLLNRRWKQLCRINSDVANIRSCFGVLILPDMPETLLVFIIFVSGQHETRLTRQNNHSSPKLNELLQTSIHFPFFFYCSLSPLTPPPSDKTTLCLVYSLQTSFSFSWHFKVLLKILLADR